MYLEYVFYIYDYLQIYTYIYLYIPIYFVYVPIYVYVYLSACLSPLSKYIYVDSLIRETAQFSRGKFSSG